jgi:uncharacterized repeat protein (TIGR04076 family)
MADDLLVEIIEVKGHCPVYKKGYSFEIKEGYKLDSEKEICMHSLASILPYYNALARGVSPEELGLTKDNEDVAYLQCLDPCDYTGGGTVIMEIRK